MLIKSRAWYLLIKCVVAMLIGVFPGGASAQLNYSSEPLIIRIGYTTFESPGELRSGTNSSFNSIKTYLAHLSRKSHDDDKFLQPIDFDIVPGNYYQIIDWFKKGSIDAAIVSPVMGMMLIEERGFPAFELSQVSLMPTGRYDVKQSADGHWPLIAAVPREPSSRQIVPDDVYHSFLECLYANVKEPRRHQLSNECKGDYHLNLISHLSATGFIAPFLHAQKWLEQRMRADDLPEKRRSEIENQFWLEYFGSAEFQFDHYSEQQAKCEPGSIFFTFGNAKSREELKCSTRWVALTDHDEKHDSPNHEPSQSLIPNNLLVFNASTAKRILNNPKVRHQEDLGHWILSDKAKKDIFGKKAGYTDIALYTGRRHQPFWEKIRDAFRRCESLRTFYRRWYQDGQYEFTIKDTLRFLHQDQVNSRVSRLSLVLPGGGVKSAYQARLLDLLYGRGDLINEREHELITAAQNQRLGNDLSISTHDVKLVRPLSSGSRPESIKNIRLDSIEPYGPTNPSLVVNEVVGTSGGAMVGLFTALLHDVRENETQLTSLWRNSEDIIVSSGDIYAFLDSPRWLSFLVILIEFTVIVSLMRKIRFLPWCNLEPVRFISRPLPALYLFLYLTIPFVAYALFFLSGPNRENVHWSEGIAFFVALFLINFIVNCLGRDVNANWRKANNFEYFLLILGLVLTVFPIIVRWSEAPLPSIFEVNASGFLPATFLFLAGLNFTLGWIIAQAFQRNMQCILEDVDGHFGRWILICLLVVFTYMLTGIAVYVWGVTLLELTDQFWATLLIAGAISSIGIIIVGLSKGTAASRVRFVRTGLVAIAKDQIVGEYHSRKPLIVIIALFGSGFLFWYYHDAPAIYGNGYALAFFQEKLKDKLPAGNERDSPLYTNLTVTATALDAFDISKNESLPPGGLYFSFRRVGASRLNLDETFEAPSTNKRLFARWDYDKSHLLDAVFASGSPSPIFPAHKVKLKWAPVHLIDGGYVHTVPLEGARLTNSRQVLLIRSSQEIWENRSDLPQLRITATNTLSSIAAKLLPFMFSQAQEVDKAIASDMVVASLSPHPKNQPFPFLADFRASQVDRVIQSAVDDYSQNRRIGLIESWGKPEYAIAIRSGRNINTRHLKLAGGGWLENVRTGLMKGITERDDSDPYIAVIELDRTCTTSSISEAVLARMIMDFDYNGENASFWNLIEDAEVRQELMDYWRSLRADAPLNLAANTDLWSSDFRDYLVRFYGYYEDKAKISQSEARAWAARLLVGKTKEQIESLTKKVWNKNTPLDKKPLLVASLKYGRSVTIRSEIRAYDQVRQLLKEIVSLGWRVYAFSSSNQYSAQFILSQLTEGLGEASGIELVRDETGKVTDISNPILLRLSDVAQFQNAKFVIGSNPSDLTMGDSENRVNLLIAHGELRKPDALNALEQPADLFLKSYTPALSFDVGNKFDASFNQSAAEGAENYKSHHGISYLSYEPTELEERELGLKKLAAMKADVIVALGTGFEESIVPVAMTYPKAKFFLIDKAVARTDALPANFHSIDFAEQEPSFLAGYHAATIGNRSIGFIGGRLISSVEKMFSGYVQGATIKDPNTIVTKCIMGNDDSVWTNQDAAQKAAISMFNNGVNIIFVAAGKANLGVYQAGYDLGKKVIGSDLVQEKQFPGTIIGTVTKDTGRIVHQIFKAFTPSVIHADGNGTIDWFSKPQTLGLKDGDVDFKMTVSESSENDQRAIAQVKQEIQNGKIKIATAAQVEQEIQNRKIKIVTIRESESFCRGKL